MDLNLDDPSDGTSSSDLTGGHPLGHALDSAEASNRGCSSVVEHLLAKEKVESSNLFIRLNQPIGRAPARFGRGRS